MKKRFASMYGGTQLMPQLMDAIALSNGFNIADEETARDLCPNCIVRLPPLWARPPMTHGPKKTNWSGGGK